MSNIYYNSNIALPVGMGIEKSGHVYGTIVGVLNEYTPEEQYVIQWTDDTSSIVARYAEHPRRQTMREFALYATDDRDFVWNKKGEGYCSHCLEGIVDFSEYRLAAADDAIQCENCGVWAGDAYSERRAAAASQHVDDFVKTIDPFRIDEIVEAAGTLKSLGDSCPNALEGAIDNESVIYILDELQGNIDKVRDMVQDLCVIQGV